MNKAQAGDLRVWWIPQVPMQAFRVPVASPEDAIRIMAILADYDQFQYENNVKPDYSNAGGLDVYEDDEWCTWYSEEGESLDEYHQSLKEYEDYFS